MTCGMLAVGGCYHPDLGHNGPCLTQRPAGMLELVYAAAAEEAADAVEGVESYRGRPILHADISTRTVGRTKMFGVSERTQKFHRAGRGDVELPVAYIVQGAASTGVALSWVKEELGNRHPNQVRVSPWGMVIRADNRTQIKDWLVELGFTVEWQGYPVSVDIDKRRSRRESEMKLDANDIRTPVDRAAQLRARAERLLAEAERYEALPDEPNVEPAVIYFERSFGDQSYVYGAVKARDGLWYTTGPKTPKGYTWEQLIQWIMPDDGSDAPDIWVATGLEQLA